MNEETITCKHCSKEIQPGENKYFSRQAGMKGHYHWECFITSCRQANQSGAQKIESISVGDESVDSGVGNYGSVDS